MYKRELGGFCGNNYGKIKRSFCSGDLRFRIHPAQYAGGFCGILTIDPNPYITPDPNVEITDCYSVSNITASFCRGTLAGFCGLNSSAKISNCYSTGSIDAAPDFQYLKGFCGILSVGQINNSFWNTQTTQLLEGCQNSSSSPGTINNLQGKTTDQMMMISIFTDAGWDFINTWNIGQNQTYPYLRKYNPADLNKDNNTNFSDFAILADNWLKTEMN